MKPCILFCGSLNFRPARLYTNKAVTFVAMLPHFVCTLVKAFDFQDKHRCTHTHIRLHSCQTSRTVLQFNWYTFTNTHTHTDTHTACTFAFCMHLLHLSSHYSHNCIANIALSLSRCLSVIPTPFCLFTISHWSQGAAQRGESAECTICKMYHK